MTERLHGVGYRLLGLAAAAAVSGCAFNWQTHPTQGRFNERAVVTEVDSEYARYYLERQLAGAPLDEDMERSLREARASLTAPLPSRTDLQRLSRQYSPDLAALLLAEHLQALPRNAHAGKLFRRHVDTLRGGDWQPLGNYHIVFAPGWFYRTVPTTGADFWRQRRLLEGYGLATRLIATGENDTVEENATVIADELLELSRRHPRIIVVSTSKSGPEVLLALGELNARGGSHAVVAWVNIGGVLRGSPLADWAMNPAARPFVKGFLLGGRSTAGLASLTTARSEERIAGVILPEQVLVLNYIALPLSGQVSERARQGYAMLRSKGPNDGHTLIVDEILPGSLSIIEIGLDHYYADPAIDLKTLALTQTVVDLLEHGVP